MLKAKALFYALVVSVLIALVSGLLISLAYLYRLQQIDQFAYAEGYRNINAALALLMNEEEDFLAPQKVKLYEGEENTVYISKWNWGLFSVVSAQAEVIQNGKRDTLVRSSLLGSKGNTYTDAALYLLDQKEPLILAGETHLEGEVYLPAAGVKRGMVNGQGFIGTELIHGKEKKSQAFVPNIDARKVEQLLHSFQEEPYGELPETGQRHSFTDETIVYREAKVYLDQLSLQGNIMIMATDTLILSASAKLEDVIVYAPTVIVEAGFHGTVQLYARDEITIAENCYFSYPSVIGLIKTKESIAVPILSIGEHTEVEGLLWVHQLRYERTLPKAKLAAMTRVKGQVWIDGSLELKGEVEGMVMARKFYLRTASSAYENYLWNTSINRNRLPDYYVEPNLYKQQRGMANAKWLY